MSSYKKLEFHQQQDEPYLNIVSESLELFQNRLLIVQNPSCHSEFSQDQNKFTIKLNDLVYIFLFFFLFHLLLFFFICYSLYLYYLFYLYLIFIYNIIY